ncbi:MAG: glutathione S-transferase family protein [Proteobacteria bacterium]|nr:glutathione S-transferase family protein [Pseudomonadota bacterium]
MAVTLHGFKFSVYAWIARFALHEKVVDYDWVEVNPFSPDMPKSYLDLHPFQRVPTLVDGSLTLYETCAITRYVDEGFDGPALQPSNPADRARMTQIIAIVDSYGYWPLVRQVFSHGFFGPRIERESDPAELEAGLKASPKVLKALSDIADDGLYLIGDHLSLADIHLAPMIGYFTKTSEGREMLKDHPKLESCWRQISARDGFVDTFPPLPD